MDVPSAHLAVVSFLCDALPPEEVNWALTGSTALALRGLEVDPKDVDVQTDVAGAFAAQEVLAPYALSPVRWSVSDGLKSYFGRFNKDGVDVEVIGALQIRREDGSWTAPTDPAQFLEIVAVGDLRVPMLTLEAEAEGYDLLGRHSTARQIRSAARESVRRDA